MSNRKSQRANRFVNEFGRKQNSAAAPGTTTPNGMISTYNNNATIDHLRVSTVKETKEEQKYVEIPMANQSDNDEDSESQADFYQPVIGLSPTAKKPSRNGKDTSNQKSDGKFFSQL